ncbi:MAG: GrpB family protein [Puia sp.]|nr:GrpB family protein [Puia sp.]
MSAILIFDYDPEWALQFKELKDIFETHLDGLIRGIEHVGSMSVAGLAAKPILDIDIIIGDTDQLDAVISKLSGIGYRYQGDLGIPDRYAFSATNEYIPITPTKRRWPKHHLYCCVSGSVSLRNHLILRDTLRNNQDLANEYADLKRKLAGIYPSDMDAYIEGKSSFIGKILQRGGMSQAEVGDIERKNKAKGA